MRFSVHTESKPPKLAGFRGQDAPFSRGQKCFYINELGWLCWEAAANQSQQLKFPDLWENTGNLIEIAQSGPLHAAIRTGFSAKFTSRSNGELINANREFSFK